MKKLEEKSTKIKGGVLVVYDARKDYRDINYCNFSFIDSELQKYMGMLKKYDKIRICS